MRYKNSFLVLTAVMLVSPFIFGQSDLERGRELYELKCGRCHFAYAPQKYSEEEWKTIMGDMGPVSGLTNNSEKEILTYLSSESKERKSSGLPTNPVLSGYLYTEYFAAKNIKNTFDIHYLNLNLSGRLHERISYRAEFELEHGGGSKNPPFIEQAYIDIRLASGLYMKIGAILAPFNRFDEFHAPLENMMVTRPQMSREIGVSAWKEVGIDLHGNIFIHDDVYLSYDAYVLNGLGDGSRLRSSRQYRDNNDNKSLGFRLSGIFFDRVELGASYYHGAWDDNGEHDLDMFGLHMLGTFRNFNAFAEYSRADSENPSPFSDGRAEGYFIQASYLFMDKIRPVVRFGTLDYLDLSDRLGRSPADMDKKVLALGLNFYLTKMIVFKFEYDFIFEGSRVASSDNDLLALQAAVRF